MRRSEEGSLSSSSRLLTHWLLVATVVGVGALGLLLFERASSAQNQSESGQSPEQTSPVFTTRHRSVSDAVAEFFDYHPAPAQQPIAFTHQVHLAKGLQCTFCHAGVDRGPDARIPSVTLCMTCHQVIDKDNPEIKKLAAYKARGEDVPWQRVYGFMETDHVKFNHAPHIRAGVQCAECHGDMTKQTVAQRKVNLNMGFCVECHEQHKVSVDCVTCHY